MSEPKLTINELIIALQKKADISDEKAKDFINRYFSIIATELKTNDSVTVSKFGTFKKKWKKQRTGRNPKTGENIEVAARYQISFTPVSAIAEKINKPYAKLKAVVLKEPVEKKIVEQKTVAKKNFDEAVFAEEDFGKAAFADETSADETSADENITPITFDDTDDSLVDFDDDFDLCIADEIAKNQKTEDDVEAAKKAAKAAEAAKKHSEIVFEEAAETKRAEAAFEDKTEIAPSPAAKAEDSSQVVRVIVSTEQPQVTYTTTTTQKPGVHEQVIERQVIKEQIIEQRVARQVNAEEENKMHNTRSDIDYRANERLIARCWFVAGIAVVCTIIILVIFASVLIGSRRENISTRRNTETTKLEQQAVDAAEMRTLKPNAYAELAALEYAEPRLWPYIYGANRLRFSAPDYEIKRREATVPPMPDRTLDRTSIEQSAIDAYRMYINEYSDRPNSAHGREKRLRAVRVLADTEQIMTGFISRYELSFDAEDIQLARRYLGN